MIFPWIFFFSEPEPFVGLAFFFVCTKEKGLEGNGYGSVGRNGQYNQRFCLE